MAENKKGFILYSDLIHTVLKLPDEKAGILFKTILEYVNDINPKVDDLLVDVVFEPIKRQLKRDLIKYDDTREDRSNAGILGNLKRWHNDLYKDVVNGKKTINESQIIAKGRTAIKPIAKIAVNVNDTVNVINSMFNFNAFWNLYDKKRNAKKTKAKWETLTEIEKEKIMLHVPKYVRSTPNKQLRKDPMTFLNNESWNDEIIQSEVTTNKNAKGGFNLGI